MWHEEKLGVGELLYELQWENLQGIQELLIQHHHPQSNL
jgi:hypothetical protein